MESPTITTRRGNVGSVVVGAIVVVVGRNVVVGFDVSGGSVSSGSTVAGGVVGTAGVVGTGNAASMSNATSVAESIDGSNVGAAEAKNEPSNVTTATAATALPAIENRTDLRCRPDHQRPSAPERMGDSTQR